MKRIITFLLAGILFCTMAEAEDLRVDLIFSNDMHGGIAVPRQLL